jgi:hypothetical protein
MAKAKGFAFVFPAPVKASFAACRKHKSQLTLTFDLIEVAGIHISNELVEDMRKLADLYDLFGLTGAG